MPDRCLNLKPWEESAVAAGASVLVRPFVLPGSQDHFGKPLNEWALSNGPMRANVRFPWNWMGSHPARIGEWVMELQCDVDDNCTVPCGQPVFEGDRAILREGWQLCDINGYLLTIRYRADKLKREVEIGGDLLRQLISRPWRPWETPQTMPASLARWRREVTGVEAVEITMVPWATWDAAGFHWQTPDELGARRPYELAEEQWLRTYGPGSWSGWVWVVRLGKGE